MLERPMKRSKFQRRMRPMRGFVWRGFKVRLFNNHYYGFKYEWCIYPIGNSMLRLTKWKGRYRKVLTDPTSTGLLTTCKEFSKMRVNEIRNVFYLLRNHL